MAVDKILSFDHEFDELSCDLQKIQTHANDLADEMSETEKMILELSQMMSEMPCAILLSDNDDIHEESTAHSNLISEEESELNSSLSEIVIPEYKDVALLSSLDIVVGIIVGVVASVIDIVFVGTPEVVKIYKGGENFDGSILTGIIRKIGNGNDKLSEMLKWLSEKCKVPYDISAIKGVANPNNHRLRNFAHDPLMGVLFAIVDIIMGTATFVDNNGHIRVEVSSKEYPMSQKILSLVYYIGHLLSDVCTARGLPIPGFFLTQFFTTGEDSSIARIAEQMYKDGYDLRHLASMTTPVIIKNLLIDVYICFFKKQELSVIDNIANKEIRANREDIFKHKLILVSDAVACSGNVLKFFIPPTSGNITALNIPEWASLLKNTLAVMKYQFRNKDVERALYNRTVIDENWLKLL